ncbi:MULTISPECIES: hypothetical protein [unclassified Streptomyces]|uniref:hypothetical protein n=1 Tax=unclassified Streptomyces TaxID=2593676 RepID=UPI000DDB1302|nr:MULTISPECIES: hypothetical protein [unclassified Streptomyces]QZZ28448.1 hypothetical protein A7X85_21145 [Streptomyces sp. ST1015]
MTKAGAVRIARSDLALGAELGGGGQGTVRVVEKRLINRTWPVVYKEYKPDAQRQLRIDVLERMVAFLPEQSPASGRWLAGHAAWPAALVTEGSQVRGFLMRQIPDDFFITMPSGDKKAAGFEFLLNSLAYVDKVVGPVTPRQVFGLLLALADTLERLHGLGVVAGDLSPKNLLFSLSGPRPSCFLIDCDAMGLGGDWVLKPVQTPGWLLPEGEAPGTPEGDRYKFALLAVRLFLHEQHGTDLAGLRRMDAAVAGLAERGLSREPADRPALGDWLDPLRRAYDSAPATWSAGAPTTGPSPFGTATGSTQPGSPAPAQTPGPFPSGPHTAHPGTPQRAPSSGRGCAIALLIVLGIIGLVLWQARSGGSGGSDGTGAGNAGSSSGQTRAEAMDTREEQAKTLDALLVQNADRRGKVSDAVQSMMNCNDLQGNRQVFEDAADARADLVNKLGELSLNQLTADLVPGLRSAWKSSEEADRAYVRVVDDVSGNCSASAVTGSSAWQDAASASADAQAAKKGFVSAWNPIAREFGLDTLAWTDL